MKLRRPGPFWSLGATVSLRRIELACWVVALGLIVLVVGGTTSTTAGAAGPIPAVSWTRSTGYCLTGAIESVPRWPSSHDLINTIDRRCLSQPGHRPRLALSQTTPDTCLRPGGSRPRDLPRHATGCLVD